MDRTTERKSDGVMERRIDGANKIRSNIKLNSYRNIDDSMDLEQGFYNAPTVGVLENYQ